MLLQSGVCLSPQVCLSSGADLTELVSRYATASHSCRASGNANICQSGGSGRRRGKARVCPGHVLKHFMHRCANIYKKSRRPLNVRSIEVHVESKAYIFSACRRSGRSAGTAVYGDRRCCGTTTSLTRCLEPRPQGSGLSNARGRGAQGMLIR